MKLIGLIIFICIAGCSPVVDEPQIYYCGTPPFGSEKIEVRIIQVLPNPGGIVSFQENITLKNFEQFDVDFTGWIAMNSAGNVIKLDGVKIISPCGVKTIILSGDDLLKDDCDTLRLYSNKNELIQTVSWTNAQPGKNITF